jgi:hypothetical protein
MPLLASPSAADMSETDHATPTRGWSPIVELRQYTLRAGRRDVLIDLFDSKFVEPQEEVGMKVIGQFRDLDNPDKFVWLRGFRYMQHRAQGLADFYGGPVWQAHREAANATMIDSDDVLLLRPARPDSVFTLDRHRLARSSSGARVRGFVEAMVMHLETAADEAEILSFFEQAIAPTLSQNGGSILGYFVTEASENTFPSLPVREGEPVFVWFAGFADRESLEYVSSQNTDTSRSAGQAPGLKRPPQVLRLAPTLRSLLHGRSPTCSAAALDPQHTRREETR